LKSIGIIVVTLTNADWVKVIKGHTVVLDVEKCFSLQKKEKAKHAKVKACSGFELSERRLCHWSYEKQDARV